MTSPSTGLDRDSAIAALLTVARREILLLAIASSTLDEEATAVAAARLRWAIDTARPLLASRSGPRAAGLARELDLIANRAQAWLVDEPVQTVQVIGLLIERVSRRGTWRGARAEAIDAGHARLADLDLDGLALPRMKLCNATLTDVTARRVGWDAADARGSHWLRCTLDGASLGMAVAAGAVLERCDLPGAALAGSSWHRATLSSCRLGGADLRDTRLDRTSFVDCDLRGADLTVARSPEAASLTGARFVRCDLRDTRWSGRELAGAVVVDCKLTGARGMPALVDGPARSF